MCRSYDKREGEDRKKIKKLRNEDN